MKISDSEKMRMWITVSTVVTLDCKFWNVTV